MKKISIIFCLVALLADCPSAFAQLLNVRIGSDALVEETVKDAIVIVESNYCIQDTETNKKYGRNGESYFNTLKFLGCKTDRGIVTSEKTLTPWSVDNLFDKYRDNTKYRPLLDSTIIVRSLPIDTIETVDLASDYSFNSDSTLICTGKGSSRTDGLMMSSDTDGGINWIIWVKTPSKEESNASPALEYSILKKSVDLKNGKVKVDTPNSSGSFMGGLYVTAKVISVGLVEFSLSGFVVEESGRWIVEPVTVETFSLTEEPGDTEISTPSPNDQDDGLTPLKEDRKDKKKKPKTPKKK